jgi:hypothetical protein
VLSESLYASAIAFFICHEAGHHFDGHDGFFISTGCVAETERWVVSKGATDSESLKKQALELGADIFGAKETLSLIVSFLLDSIPPGEYDENQQLSYQKQIAFLAASGLFTSLFIFRPAPDEDVNGSHPPSAFRALWFANYITQEIDGYFNRLKIDQLRNLVFQALEIGAAVSVIPNKVKFDEFAKYAQREGDMAALRATGIRKLIFDDNVMNYFAAIFALYSELKDQLKDKARGIGAMPIMANDQFHEG